MNIIQYKKLTYCASNVNYFGEQYFCFIRFPKFVRYMDGTREASHPAINQATFKIWPKIGRSRKSLRPEMLLRLVTAPNWPRFHSRTSAGSIVLLHVQVISHTLPNGRASAHDQVPVPHQCHLILYSIPSSCHTHQSLLPPPLGGDDIIPIPVTTI